MRHVAGGEIREIIFRQRLQGEARAAGADRQHRAIAVAFQHDLGAVGQFAHDVVEHMRRHGGRPGGSGFRRQRFRHLEVEVGGFQRQSRALGAKQHVAEDRDGVATLDHTMDVSQRFQQLRAFDGNLHCNTRPIRRWKSRAAQGARRASETRRARSKLDLIRPVGEPKVARMARQRKRCVAPFPTFCRGIDTFAEPPRPWPERSLEGYCWAGAAREPSIPAIGA
jgi:hypothetical protein